MTLSTLVSSLRVGIAMLLVSALALADTKMEINAGVDAALQQFYAQDHSHRDLVDKAAAVLVFPRITKGGAALAGAYGEGALLEHGHIVGYYKIASASLGATVGFAQRREIMLFMTDEARDRFVKNHGWAIGADAGVAVLSKGAGGQYDSQTLRKPVLAFVFGEKGLIGDVSLEGTKISEIAS